MFPVGSMAAGLARTDVAIKEWAGLFAGWLFGQTGELFPRPQRCRAAATRPRTIAAPQVRDSYGYQIENISAETLKRKIRKE